MFLGLARQTVLREINWNIEAEAKYDLNLLLKKIPSLKWTSAGRFQPFLSQGNSRVLQVIGLALTRLYLQGDCNYLEWIKRK